MPKPAQSPIIFGELPQTGFVRTAPLLAVIGVSRSTLNRWVESGYFPSPVRLSKGIVAFRVAEVRQWITAKSSKEN